MEVVTVNCILYNRTSARGRIAGSQKYEEQRTGASSSRCPPQTAQTVNQPFRYDAQRERSEWKAAMAQPTETARR